MSEELKRDEFEKWLIDNKMAYGVRRDGDSYYSREIHNMWCSWKAGLRASRPEAESEMPAVDLIAAGALRQFRHNDDVSPSGEMVAAYDKKIVDREFARLHARVAGNAAQDDARDAWISVDDERKPNEQTPILVFVRTLTRGEDDNGRPYEVEGEQVEMGEYRHNNGSPYFQCFISPMSDNDWITHWMPLPEPPAIDAAIKASKQEKS